MNEETGWYTCTAQEASGKLATDPVAGLSTQEAESRLERYGHNQLSEEKKDSVIKRFLGQFNDFMIWVLLAAAGISIMIAAREGTNDGYIDAIVIMIIVILNAIMGHVQESRAESALAKLKELSSPTVTVIRDGKEQEAQAKDLVVGDLLTIEPGDMISADCRLLDAVNLMVNESSLTGESRSVGKKPEVTLPEKTPLGDRLNMIFSGTHIENGRGKAVVVATGKDTELGKIASLIEEAKPALTPLQVELNDIGKRIVYLCLMIVSVVFVVGLFRSHEVTEMLMISVSLAVAAIPEGLPAVVTITLAQGMQAMAKENAIVRNLPAVETLGCANYICSDKTGTLTLNRMTITDLVFADGSTLAVEKALTANDWRPGILRRMAVAGALCNDARRNEDGQALGDPTEVALIDVAERLGLAKSDLENARPRVAEVQFNSERKMMSTVSLFGDRVDVYSKGAVEVLLERCTHVVKEKGVEPLTDETKSTILDATMELGERALRTIGIAYRELASQPEEEEIEQELIFLGAFAMKDPPRQEVYAALETCRLAEIEVAMITGDMLTTACAVADELGIIERGQEVLEGTELETMTDEELDALVEDVRVYARVSPNHKVKIVQSLKRKGHVVAMTGDGVNDAPALKNADIGVAMGITGTDVSKEASDMILADDNFATIVSAVRQGRIIFSNLKKFVYFLLSCNISEVLVIFISMLAGWPLPLVAVQILWINLATDGIPALALGMDTPEPDIMEQPPRKTGENVLSTRKQLWLGWQGLLLTISVLAAFLIAHFSLGFDWNDEIGLMRCQTVVFTTLVFAQIVHSLNMRSERLSVLKAKPWENRWMMWAILVSILLQLFVLGVPFMQEAFNVEWPSTGSWITIICCSLAPSILINRIKVITAWHGERRIAKAGGF